MAAIIKCKTSSIEEVKAYLKKEFKTLSETVKKSGNLLDKISGDTKDILMDLK